MTTDKSTRYGRQMALPEIGVEGQERLRRSAALIVGTGGLGSVVAPYLVGSGIGRLILADHDKVSVSNLHRQILYAQEDVGKNKARTAAGKLRNHNSEVEIIAVEQMFTPENAADMTKECDIVIDCTDNFSTRLLINSLCKEKGIPWIFGAVEAFSGMVSFFNPSDGADFHDIFPDMEIARQSDVNLKGILGPVAGVVGSVQALECIKFLAGIPSSLQGKLLTIDFSTMTTELFECQ